MPSLTYVSAPNVSLVRLSTRIPLSWVADNVSKKPHHITNCYYFSNRSRASAQGFGAAWNYLVTFIGAKTYVDLETSFQLWGTFAVYAAFGFIGTIYLYFFIPETEGIPLHDIENFYNGKFRTFADDPFTRFFKRFKRKGTSEQL